jgi:hypothetical protein
MTVMNGTRGANDCFHDIKNLPMTVNMSELQTDFILQTVLGTTKQQQHPLCAESNRSENRPIPTDTFREKLYRAPLVSTLQMLQHDV